MTLEMQDVTVGSVTLRVVGDGRVWRITNGRGEPTLYTIRRGDYIGTTDDRRDRWYIEDDSTDTVDRRYIGYMSVGDALTSLAKDESMRDAGW